MQQAETSETDRGRCLDAFSVALIQACDEKGWYASTSQLQLASLHLCILCRTRPTLRLRVKHDTPTRLWATDEARADAFQPDAATSPCFTRVPSIWALAWMWDVPASMLRGSSGTLARAECLIFGFDVTDSYDNIAFPRGVKELTFSRNFQLPIEHISWPASLRQLKFGHLFNQPIDEVVWPASLRNLTFGAWFVQPIDRVAWPESLRQLEFGHRFNQPIVEAVWPALLRQLSFGYLFNQPIKGVAWPASLQHLSLGKSFNHPIADVAWPASLQEIELGQDFKQPIDQAAWPPSLQQLARRRFLTPRIP